MGPRPPTVQDILRYRYQHGTNLGATFVLERWLRPSMYEDTIGSSELEAVKRSIQVSGLEETRSKWETHWLTALTKDDFDWLRDVARCNSIRLPIGFFTLGPMFCLGTAFEGEPSQVYVNAWNAAKQLIGDCHRHGIGVLIDLHAVPGGANSEGHSGTDSGKAELWNSRHNRALANKCISFIVREVAYHAVPGVIGIEVCNEAMWDAPGMYEWYDEVLEITSALDPTMPIYISDGWNLSRALQYSASKNTTETSSSAAAPLLSTNPLFVDTHIYYTFTEADRSKGPYDIIERVKGVLSHGQGNVTDKKGATAVYIGEYSCTLDTQTWNHVHPSLRPQLTAAFGQEQTKQWMSKASGSAFWTFKMDWMDGGDWGFKEQVNTGAIPAPAWLAIPRAQVTFLVEQAGAQRGQFRDRTYAEHGGFWDLTTAPGSEWNHSRFASGWDLGFADAMSFFRARAYDFIPGECDGGDKIGAVDLWVRKRMIETDQIYESLCWEWEHGFRKGIDDFYSSIGI